MALKFWKDLREKICVEQNRPIMVLAPMANVTDWAFRQIVKECGAPDVFYTEFISADGIKAIGPERFKGELYFEKSEGPIVVQFFSSKPENIKQAVEIACELGFNGIDINMGCPDRSVEKQGAGAALIKNISLAKEIIKTAYNTAKNMPISVKTRLGYSKIETDTWIAGLLDTEIAALTVHARTRKEMSSVPAHWEEMGRISEMAKRSGKIIIGNGDVNSLAEAKEKADTYKLDGIMIGRGIFANPWLFNNNKPQTSAFDKTRLLLKHVDNFERLWGQDKNFDTLKKFFKIYVNGWQGASGLRSELMQTKNPEQVRNILSSRYNIYC